jgi:hypothetical protein
MKMISNKMSQLKQDLVEIKGKFEDMKLEVKNQNVEIVGYKDLKEAIEILEEHLKDHIETMENFIQSVD